MKKISIIILLIFVGTLLFHWATGMKDNPNNVREFFRISEFMSEKIKRLESSVKQVSNGLKEFRDKVANVTSENKILRQIAHIVSYPIGIIRIITVKFGTFPTFLFAVLLYFSLKFMFKYRSKFGD